MKSQSRSIRRQWEGSTISWTGKSWLITDEMQCPAILMAVDELVHEIALSVGDLFKIELNKQGIPKVCSNTLGKTVLKAISLDVESVHRHLPRHRFSPHFELWEKSIGSFPANAVPIFVQEVAAVNEWVDHLRKRALSDPYSTEIEKCKRSADKNAKSLRKYIDTLFSKHAKLLFVRVDVGYRHECPDINSPPEVTDEETTEHLSTLINFIQTEIPPKVGYVWKREYGAFKGAHNHLMLILNGHQAREGITWGKIIGEKWNEIVGGRGVYWNCNANEEEYLRRGRLGIGLIHYSDAVLRAGLDYAAMYLVKADYYARFHSPAIKKTFGKGLARRKKETRGRRRNKS